MPPIKGLDGAGEDDDKAPPASAAAGPPRHRNRISLVGRQWALRAYTLQPMLLDMPHIRVIPKRALANVLGRHQ
jgi:hypothetical protein